VKAKPEPGEIPLLAAILRGLPKLDGACKAVDPRVMDGATHETRDAALELCSRCPCLDACRAWALSEASGIKTGVVGGLVLGKVLPARCANGCQANAHALCLCLRCYRAAWRESTKATAPKAPKAPRPPKVRAQCVNGCEADAYSKGVCEKCYRTDLRAEVGAGLRERPTCINGCDRPSHAKGLCHSCISQKRRDDAKARAG
jgi:hypothetical protein